MSTLYKQRKDGNMIGSLIAKSGFLRSFEALNRRNLQMFMSSWAENGVFVYPGDVKASGTFQGKENVEKWFHQFLEQFPTLEFDVQDICVSNLFDLIGNNVLTAHWNLHVVNRGGYESRYNGITLAVVKRGKVVMSKDFIFDLGENFKRNWSA